MTNIVRESGLEALRRAIKDNSDSNSNPQYKLLTESDGGAGTAQEKKQAQLQNITWRQASGDTDFNPVNIDLVVNSRKNPLILTDGTLIYNSASTLTDDTP